MNFKVLKSSNASRLCKAVFLKPYVASLSHVWLRKGVEYEGQIVGYSTTPWSPKNAAGSGSVIG